MAGHLWLHVTKGVRWDSHVGWVRIEMGRSVGWVWCHVWRWLVWIVRVREGLVHLWREAHGRMRRVRWWWMTERTLPVLTVRHVVGVSTGGGRS